MTRDQMGDIINRAGEALEAAGADPELINEVLSLALYAGKAACRHGEITEVGMCEQCYIDDDFAYDMSRERGGIPF